MKIARDHSMMLIIDWRSLVIPPIELGVLHELAKWRVDHYLTFT